MLQPVIDEPALVVSNLHTTLVLADIHLGIEWSLQQSGVNIPSQIRKRTDRIMRLIGNVKPDRIVLLGDIKHNIPGATRQEREEVPEFIGKLAGFAQVEIVPGNHDGDLEKLLADIREVQVHDMEGFVFDGVGYFHGHAWPNPEVLSVKYVVVSHNHPAIRFTDRLGHSTVEPVWIRTRFRFDALSEEYGQFEWCDPEVYIMPAFNELCGGVAFNESSNEDLLGPIFKKAIELDSATVYLLDGTKLGTLKDIRESPITRYRSKGFFSRKGRSHKQGSGKLRHKTK